jgi:hypothetical protein
MYGRMRHKGICLVLALLATVPARALERRLVLVPSSASPQAPAPNGAAPSGAPLALEGRSLGTWSADGAVTRKGFKGLDDYVLAQSVYSPDPDADLILHLDRRGESDAAGRWELSAGPDYSIDTERAILGAGAGSFRGSGSGLTLVPGPEALFARNSRFSDFSIEAWLYPANVENGEIILLWQSARNIPGNVLAQHLSCVVSGGRLQWSLVNLFAPPGSGAPAAAAGRVELRARGALVPRRWSHHLLRFDGDTGLVEYLVDGLPEATAYVTSTGREGGVVHLPAIGAASPLKLFSAYSGLADEVRVCARFVDAPNLKPYGRDPAQVLSPIADLGYGHSRLVAVECEGKTPGGTTLEFAYRIADDWTSWRSGAAAWTPFRPGEALPESARGRYAQVRVELYPDGSGLLTPALSSLTLRFEPDPPPPPPGRVAAAPKDGAVELRWSRVPESDVAGYLVYYGDASGEYQGTGADQGPSPVDSGDADSITLTGIPNGRLLYFAVATYDAAALSAPGGASSRAGEFSPEVSARPSRTAK